MPWFMIGQVLCWFCNDKSFVCPPPIYNCKHVCMYIVVLANKAIYANGISHVHWYDSCVYNHGHI